MSRRRSPPQPPQRPQRGAGGAAWAKAARVLARHRERLLRRVGVIGVDLGLKRSAGRLLKGPCIRVHVQSKLQPGAMRPNRLLPKAIEGVPIDVVESQFSRSMACVGAAARHRGMVVPLQGGCSIGRFGETDFGTLGAIANDSAGAEGGITCAHVCRTADRMVQPHRLGPAIGDGAAEVDDAEVDAAFVAFNGARASVAEVLGFGPVAGQPAEVLASELPLAVELVGACSGRTRGTVVSVDFQGWVEGPAGEKFVRGQMCIEPSGGGIFSRGGDSGGGVLRGNRFAGLLIAAGKPALGGVGLATPMSRLLARLGVQLR